MTVAHAERTESGGESKRKGRPGRSGRSVLTERYFQGRKEEGTGRDGDVVSVGSQWGVSRVSGPLASLSVAPHPFVSTGTTRGRGRQVAKSARVLIRYLDEPYETIR